MYGVPYDGDFLSIMYEMVWASLMQNARKGTFGGIVSFFPLEGNIMAAQDQKILYNYLKWRGRQRGVGYLVYHVHIFIPPILHELKVEEILHELSSWRVTHFVWLIARGGEIQMGMMNPNLYQPSCLKRTFKEPIVASMDVSLSHNVSYLGCSPIDGLNTWEGKLGDILMMQHLDPSRISSYEVATGEKRILVSHILAIS